MARIKRFGTTYNPELSSYLTFITDTDPNSKYFRISDFSDIFAGGKNSFLIEGSEHLKETTEIKISVIDVNGNPVYNEPGDGIPEYYEGINKVVSIHVYEDTPIGQATITILGELKTYLDESGITREIPEEWKGVYNVKWERTFTLNKNLSNEDLVRFYRRPKVSITELVKPVYSAGFVTKNQTGLAFGQPLVPVENFTLNNFNGPTSYRIKIPNTNNTWWTGSLVGNTITFPNLDYTATVEAVVNSKEIIVNEPYTENGIVKPFTSETYNTSFRHLEGVTNIATALTGSFARIALTDLTTFTGDVARVRVFRKSESDVADYQFIQEILLEANELLFDSNTKTKNQESYGYFTQDVIANYWTTSSNNLAVTFNQDYLYNSVKLDGESTPRFFRTKNPPNDSYTTTTDTTIPITTNGEYTLDFNLRLAQNSSTDNYIRAFLSGSKQTTFENVTKTIQVDQTITKIFSSDAILQQSTVIENVIAEEMENARLYFEVKGSGWHVSNISFKASQETSFSPDEITFIQSVPRSLAVETFKYKFEFYDINNNYIPVLVEATKEFNGGNLQDLQKSLRFNPNALYFTFDSASVPVPPLFQGFTIQKNLLTGSINWYSSSYDSFGNLLNSSQYTGVGSKFPGFLTNRTTDTPFMTVTDFTGSRDDIDVQYIVITGEVEGYTDSVTYSRVLDGFGGVSHIIRPYRGTDIRNSSTQSLEIQAVRIDGVNEVVLNNSARPNRGWNKIQLHVLSGSLNEATEPQRFVNLMYVTASDFIKGVTVGELGSKEINFNAIFNRDSINKRLTVYLMESCSLDGPPAYIASASVLTSIVLSDFQDGLDAGVIKYDTDHFNINFRDTSQFKPVYSNVTGSFYIRGTNDNPLTASLTIYPSMSINKDFTPEYWMYYVTHSSTWNPNISVVATDEKNNKIKSQPTNNSYDSFLGSFVRPASLQSKTLTITYTYTEPYTSASVSVDKTFTIVPEGKPGDEPVIFEVNPATVELKANPKGAVLSYSSSVTEIRLKQGSRYLIYTASRKDGTFYAVQDSFSSQKINPGYIINVPKGPGFNKDYTGSLFIGTANSLIDLSGSVTYKLEIQPYYTSSVYSASFTQNYKKIMDGPPPLEVIISPIAQTLNADEVGYITPDGYRAATTTIKVREGNDYLTFTTLSAAPGTFRIQGTSGNPGGSVVGSNIQVGIIDPIATDTGRIFFNRFDYPYVSASVDYNIVVFPYSLTAGHQYTSSVVNRTQVFRKSVATAAARSVTLDFQSDLNESISRTINYDGDGLNPTPSAAKLKATAYNTTGSVYYRFEFDDGSSPNGFLTNPPNYGYTTDDFYDLDSSEFPEPGQNKTFTVKIKDGNTGPAIVERAQASLTISGVKQGDKAYNALLTNENSAMLYKVSGQQSRVGTGTRILATKGDEPLTHVSSFSPKSTNPFTGAEIGSIGEYRVKVVSKSNHITLASGVDANPGTNIVPTVSGEAVLGDLVGWNDEITNQTAQIVYEIDFENGRQITYKTQSFVVQYEGNVGPGIVFRGEWRNDIDYLGQVETNSYRRDAVLYRADGTSRYYLSISGSGPATYNNQGTLVGPQTPPDYTLPVNPKGYWQYAGTQQFFVAAQVAIFDDSFVKNTLSIGTKGETDKFANIVFAGNRTDPFMAMGQNGTVGTYSTSGTTVVTPGIIGYGRPGVFLGIYENGAAGTTGRFSIVKHLSGGAGTRGLYWDGDNLIIKGGINQSQEGTNNGRQMGAWAAGIEYYNLDQVTYGGYSWSSNSQHVSTNTTNAVTGYPGYGPWSISPYAAKTVRQSASAQVFTELKSGALTPDYIQLTATKENISATTNWSTSPSVNLYDTAGPAGGSVVSTGDTVFLRKADFGSNNLVEVTSTSDGRTDKISIVRVKEGSDAITIVLTNESHTIAAAADGTVASYTNSGTDIQVYEGATKLDYDGTGTAAAKWTVTAAGTSVTAGALSDIGTDARMAAVSAMSADQAIVTFTISGKKINGTAFGPITRIQSLTKARKGEVGATGSTGAGIVFRGEWRNGIEYIRSATRIDVVAVPGGSLPGVNCNYWICRSTHTSNSDGPPNSNCNQTTYWDSFSNNFDSVATDILFSQDVYANRTINIGMGTNGTAGTSGRRIEMSSDYPSGVNPYIRIGNVGYNNNGIFVGYDGGTPKLSLKNSTNYLRWTGAELEIGSPNFTLDAAGNITATNATLTGVVQASTGYLGGLAGWIVSAGLLRDANSRIKLNAVTPSIEIYNSSNQKKIDIRNGALTSVGGSTGGIAVNPGAGPLSATTTTIYSWYGSSTRIMGTVGGSTVTISTTGMYKFVAPSWFSSISQFIYVGAGTMFGAIWMELYLAFYTVSSPTSTDVPVASIKIGETGVLSSAPGAVSLDPINDEQYLSLGAGTYYVSTYLQPFGGTSKSPIVLNYSGITYDPASTNITLQLDQIEVTDEGILIVNGTDKYVKLVRDVSSHTAMIEAKQNDSKPTLQISNIYSGAGSLTNDTGLSVNVPDGGVNIARKLFVQGMVTNPVGLSNENVKVITQAGTRYGEYFISTSTRKDKKDIVDWNYSVLDKIKLVNPKKFRYNEWPDTSELVLGMIAEDLRDSGLEDAAMHIYDENGQRTNEVRSIDWEKLSVILWKAVQELTERVENLENK